VSASPRECQYDERLVSGVLVRVTELVWADEHRSYQVHLVNGATDLTENGCFDNPPTDTLIKDLLAEHHAARTLRGNTTSADLLRDLLAIASAQIGWQVDLDQLPVTCAHTPRLVVDLIDAAAAHLAALAAHAALTEAAQSIQTVITAAEPGTVDWFTAGLLGTVAHLANRRSPSSDTPAAPSPPRCRPCRTRASHGHPTQPSPPARLGRQALPSPPSKAARSGHPRGGHPRGGHP
jgi:hypothetical protein